MHPWNSVTYILMHHRLVDLCSRADRHPSSTPCLNMYNLCTFSTSHWTSLPSQHLQTMWCNVPPEWILPAWAFQFPSLQLCTFIHPVFFSFRRQVWLPCRLTTCGPWSQGQRLTCLTCLQLTMRTWWHSLKEPCISSQSLLLGGRDQP